MKEQLLDEIRKGKTSYRADRGREPEFELAVAVLQELNDEGLITAIFHQESSSGNRSIDLVYNINLTDAGRAYLGVE